MLLNIKALVVVLVIAGTIFWIARPIVLQFCSASDFERRRNVWFAVTAAAFLAPSFWWFVVVAAPVLLWGARKDPNPVAFYVSVLFAVPSVAVDIPFVGINHLFELDFFRLLSLCVLAPAAWHLQRSRRGSRIRGLEAMDMLLLGFGALQVVLYVPPDPAIVHNIIYHNSATNALRSAFLFFLDVYLLYFVVSRGCTTPRAVAEALAAFCLACVILAPIAVFESVRHWLLYVSIGPAWGVPMPLDTYFMRGGALRAQATAGHAITLGYLFDVALGFWLYLQTRVRAMNVKIAVPALLGLGLLVTYSRAPWLAAVVIYLAFVALGARSWPQLFKAVCAVALLGIAVAVSPFGIRIVKLLPYVGESPASDNSLAYRERLAERSWELIQEHPLLGQQMVYSRMEDLRQGQGIIDFVNTYAQIALFYGGVGLLLFLAFIFIAVAKVHRVLGDIGTKDRDLGALGRSLLACIFGTLLVIATGSLIGGTQRMFYLLAGLMIAYVHLPRAARVTARPHAVRTSISSRV